MSQKEAPRSLGALLTRDAPRVSLFRPEYGCRGSTSVGPRSTRSLFHAMSVGPLRPPSLKVLDGPFGLALFHLTIRICIICLYPQDPGNAVRGLWQ
jgi:hypothetical protein